MSKAVVVVLGLIFIGAHAVGAADCPTASHKPAVQRCQISQIEGGNGTCEVSPQLVLARLAGSEYLRARYLARAKAFDVVCSGTTEAECSAWGSDYCMWADNGNGNWTCTPSDMLTDTMTQTLGSNLYCPGTRPYNLMRCTMQAEMAQGNMTKKEACEGPKDNGCVWVKNAANTGEGACLNQHSAKMAPWDLASYMDKLAAERKMPVYNPAKYGCCATWLAWAMNQQCMNLEDMGNCTTKPYCQWSGEESGGTCMSDDVVVLKMILPMSVWDLLAEDINACSAAVPGKQSMGYGSEDEQSSASQESMRYGSPMMEGSSDMGSMSYGSPDAEGSTSEGSMSYGSPMMEGSSYTDSAGESASEGPSDEELCGAVRVTGVELLTPDQVMALIQEEPPIVDIRTCPTEFAF